MINVEERLNPIVWKELRQGLKSKGFVATFLGLQGAMVISMLTYAASADGDQGFADGMFWFFLGVMLLLMMPLRALGALHGEIKGNTLDMLFLSRMSSWDIAFGKWLALLVQIVLLVCAILPYLVVRYYMGSVDVTSDLVLLFSEMVISCLLVAIGVGLSSWTSKVMRGLLIFAALSSLYSLPFMLFAMFDSGSSWFRFWNGWDVIAWLLVLIGVMLYFVEYGASQIAPPAENHAIRKRGLGLIITLVLIVYALLVEQSSQPIAIGLALMIPIMIDAVVEPMYAIPTLYRPYRKWKAFRWLIYPGWPGGLLASVLIFMLAVSVGAFFDGTEFVGGALVFFNVLLVPVLLIQIMPSLKRKPMLSYIAIQIAGFMMVIFIFIINDMGNYSDLDAAAAILFPHTGIFVLMGDGADEFENLEILIATAVMLIACFVIARPIWSQMNRLSQQETADG